MEAIKHLKFNSINMISIKLQGIDKLKSIYANAANELADEVKDAITASAQAMADKARQKSKGELQQSVTAQIADDGMSATISANEPYAPYVEYGTHKMGAEPFMNPAFEEEAPQFINALKKITGQ